MNGNSVSNTAAEILLVEDSPSDARLTEEALKEGGTDHRLSVVRDGEQALAFLRRDAPFAKAPRPSLILLDLNLPKKDGREVLKEIKADDHLKIIPVCILSTSSDPQDVLNAYQLNVNCYITKSMDMEEFMAKVQHANAFWLTTVLLPPSI